MSGTLCITSHGSVRLNTYTNGSSAALGLSDEVVVMPADAKVLVGDTWFVITTPAYASILLASFPELHQLTEDEVRSLSMNPIPANEQDICVVVIASILEAITNHDFKEAGNISESYSTLFPEAVKAANKTGIRYSSNIQKQDSLNDSVKSDPFAWSTILATLVSPLKSHCEPSE